MFNQLKWPTVSKQEGSLFKSALALAPLPCVWKWTKSAGGRSGELERLMEVNALPAKMPFTMVFGAGQCQHGQPYQKTAVTF